MTVIPRHIMDIIKEENVLIAQTDIQYSPLHVSQLVEERWASAGAVRSSQFSLLV